MKNKKLRNLIIAGAAIASPIVINKSVFLIASKKYPMLDAIHTYDWRLGKIGYSVKGNGKPVVLIHGAKPGEAQQDLEGIATVRNLAKNMAFLMKSIALGKETYGLPEYDQRQATNFIR